MYCLITNGEQSVDITPYIAYQGWKVSRNDIDGQNAGRNIEGTMIRDLVTSKRRIDVTIIPLPVEQMATLLGVLDGETISVTYDDVQFGRITKTMYSNNFSWTYCMKDQSDTEFYNGLSFPLIEV